MKKNGITLLLVVMIASALLTIGNSIFRVIYGEIVLSGELAESYKAFYAADRHIDKFLYMVRMGSGLNDGDTWDTTGSVMPPNEGCAITMIYKTPASVLANCQLTTAGVCIKSVGQSRCGPSTGRLVKRGFMVVY